MNETPRITPAEFDALLREHLPMAAAWRVETIELGHGHARMRVGYDAAFLRPGGTISGPVQMGLADVAVYAALLGAIGPVHGAVTSSLSCNFLRRPAPVGIEAVARILKLGKRLAVGEVELYSEGATDMIAHVVATYAIP